MRLALIKYRLIAGKGTVEIDLLYDRIMYEAYVQLLKVMIFRAKP